MFEIRANPKRNRLYMRLAGEIPLTEMEHAHALAKAEIQKLRRGYDVVSDVTALSELPADTTAPARQMMETVKAGSRRIVHVVGKASKVAVQLERMSKAVGLEPYLAFSNEEAERLLDGGLDLG